MSFPKISLFFILKTIKETLQNIDAIARFLSRQSYYHESYISIYSSQAKCNQCDQGCTFGSKTVKLGYNGSSTHKKTINLTFDIKNIV